MPINTTLSDAQWDTFVRQHPRANFLQLSAWAKLKCAYGWSTDRVALVADDQVVAGAQMLFRPLPLRLGTLAYLPYGGYVRDAHQWPDLWDAIHTCAKQNDAALLKWEPGHYMGEFRPDFTQWGFRESLQQVQPPNTVLLDLTQSDDDLMAAMNQSTRRNIRKAYKNDIHYYEATLDDFEKFARIIAVTGDRNEFGVHEPAYYHKMVELFVPDDAVLILAEHEGDTLAANLVMQSGDVAIYLEGASSSKKRKLMASYGVQWEGIQWAKQRGLHYYDMWGVPDEDQATLEDQFRERSDGLWGVYRFKRGWGGAIMRTAGAWDYVYNPIVYTAYQAALKLRQ